MSDFTAQPLDDAFICPVALEEIASRGQPACFFGCGHKVSAVAANALMKAAIQPPQCPVCRHSAGAPQVDHVFSQAAIAVIEARVFVCNKCKQSCVGKQQRDEHRCGVASGAAAAAAAATAATDGAIPKQQQQQQQANPGGNAGADAGAVKICRDCRLHPANPGFDLCNNCFRWQRKQQRPPICHYCRRKPANVPHCGCEECFLEKRYMFCSLCQRNPTNRPHELCLECYTSNTKQ